VRSVRHRDALDIVRRPFGQSRWGIEIGLDSEISHSFPVIDKVAVSFPVIDKVAVSIALAGAVGEIVASEEPSFLA
jgi:hypothetical protein